MYCVYLVLPAGLLIIILNMGGLEYLAGDLIGGTKKEDCYLVSETATLNTGRLVNGYCVICLAGNGQE